MSSKGNKGDGVQDSWKEEEKKYHLLAEEKRKLQEKIIKEEYEAKLVQDKKMFVDNKSKQLFELAKEEAKKEEILRIENENKCRSTSNENQLKFLEEQKKTLESISKDEEEKKASLTEKVKKQEAVTKKEFARHQELENQTREEGEQSKLDKEGLLLLFHDEVRKEEGRRALLENEKRLQKQTQHKEEKEKTEEIEKKRASIEIRSRSKLALLVKDHEMDCAKTLDDTHQAKTRDESLKGKRWEEEKINEDIEMEERIKARNALLKQKLVEYEKIREETENDARIMEASALKMSKACKERRIEEIGIDKFHEEERRKKEEAVKKRFLVEEKRSQIDSMKLEMEGKALAKEKEKRRELFVKQEAELSRFEKELKEGDDLRTRREVEKMKNIEMQIEKEEKEASDMFQRQKIRNQEQDTKKDAIAKDAESFAAIQATKRKNLQDSKKEVEKLVSLHDEYLKKEENNKRKTEQERLEKEKHRREAEKEREEAEMTKLLEVQKRKKRDQEEIKHEDEKVLQDQRKQRGDKDRQTEATTRLLSDERERDEERLRVEGSRRRELQLQLQQEEIMKQQDAEMELLMASRRVKATVVGDSEKPAKTKSEKKGLFGGLFQKRNPKE